MEEQSLRSLLKANTNGYYKPVHVDNIPRFKRNSKTAPIELTSKIPVSRFKKIKFYKQGEDPTKGILLKKHKSRDPRFDNISGTYNEHFFKLSYKFLDDNRQRELAELKEELKASRDPEERKLVQRALNKKKEEIRQLEMKQREQSIKKDLEHTTKEAVKHGKQPYFFKSKIVKMMAAKQHLEELKNKGELEDFTAKRMKRERSKDAKKIRAVNKKRKLLIEE
mmetsp:Transcript_9877/g.19585  ORF Transcript_9877/g.19585 Transcript_9877/m.19585 type:complete len:223 (+) Transcript_9877:3309-3977(+)